MMNKKLKENVLHGLDKCGRNEGDEGRTVQHEFGELMYVTTSARVEHVCCRLWMCFRGNKDGHLPMLFGVAGILYVCLRVCTLAFMRGCILALLKFIVCLSFVFKCGVFSAYLPSKCTSTTCSRGCIMSFADC
ncbi:expressed protein [Echinococcus multilocularis]|uniref:Expressed protein n=1 Tax=Echinococcus multilocularis TaxID=6211 RepID=A0A0S4MJT5_ECHMU|nr:expressed protein [Echinococcus multilocularis]